MATADNVIISVQNLCKYFKKDAIRALDGISVDIRQGDVIAAIGPSGSIMSARTMATRCFWPPESWMG